MVLRVFVIVVVTKNKWKLYYVRNIYEYLMMYGMHTQYEQEQ